MKVNFLFVSAFIGNGVIGIKETGRRLELMNEICLEY